MNFVAPGGIRIDPAGQPDTRKSYRRGTHRIVPPGETVSRFVRYASDLGITRLANVTGLDYLGIPVFMAVRPNARSLSVSQGKGLDNDAASASAFMEAVESEHAERIERPMKMASYAALKEEAFVAAPGQLPRATRTRLQPDYKIPWIEGRDIASAESIWVPFELVHADFRKPSLAGTGFFATSSNGLASGNHRLEAICHGICEAIERDATRLHDGDHVSRYHDGSGPDRVANERSDK